MKFITAQEMINIQKKKKERRQEAFEKILESIYKKMQGCITVTRNVNTLIFEVPEVMIGYPLYHLNECVTYLIEFLQGEGFKVVYTFPKTLQISWEPKVPPSKKAAEPQRLPSTQTGQPDQNTKRIVRKGKNTTTAGKFTLNLT